MRLQVLLPIDAGVDVSAVRSYLAARFLLKNDMPIRFIVNDGDGSCPELDDIGVADTDEPGKPLADAARSDLPDRGDEAQFLFCGRTRSPGEIFTSVAEWFNHLATGRTVHGVFGVVYVVPHDLVDEACRCLDTMQRIRTVAINRVEVRQIDGFVVGQPSRGPRFMVERENLDTILESILTDLSDMDQAYDEEEA